MPAPRTIVYVDGFNLYYGAVRKTRSKWLNIELLFRRLRPHDEIRRIYYFTALVDRREKAARQMQYLKALETCPLVTTVIGRFKMKKVKCTVKQCTYKGRRLFEVPEEKRTDVSIATQIIDDAYQDEMDNMVVISGDSDLVPTLDRIRERFPEKKIIVYIPAPSKGHVRAAAVELRAAAHQARELPVILIRRSQFPRTVVGRNGKDIIKPPEW